MRPGEGHDFVLCAALPEVKHQAGSGATGFVQGMAGQCIHRGAHSCH